MKILGPVKNMVGYLRILIARNVQYLLGKCNVKGGASAKSTAG